MTPLEETIYKQVEEDLCHKCIHRLYKLLLRVRHCRLVNVAWIPGCGTFRLIGENRCSSLKN